MTAAGARGTPGDHDFARPFSEIWAEHIETNNKKPFEKLSHTPHPHTVAVKSVVDACQKLPGWKRVRKRPVGRFIVTDGNGNPRKQSGKWIYVRVAITGDADVEILWTPPGANRPYAIMCEVKTGSATLNEDQRDSRDFVLEGGCLHIVAKDGADAFQQIMRLPRK